MRVGDERLDAGEMFLYCFLESVFRLGKIFQMEGFWELYHL